MSIRNGVLLTLIISTLQLFSQNTDAPDPGPVMKKSKLLTGFYVGSYFANKYSASTYNGYGFDVYGNRNTFLNSFMYQKIVQQYGGYGTGQYDQIAAALGVDQHQWSFTESDMPVNMRYKPAILVGFNFKIPMDRKTAIILNVNGSKIGVEGDFTMTTLTPPTSNNPAYNSNLVVCAIQGREQRLQFELGFQRILGNDDKTNFFVEAGFVGTLSKFDQNTITINNSMNNNLSNSLTIDLTSYYNQTYYAAPGPTKRPIGFGIGAFAGCGLNIEASAKITAQLLYTLSDEKVNIGTNPTLKLQNGLGLRVYYNF